MVSAEKILLLCNGRFSFIIVNSQANFFCGTLLIIKYLLFTKSFKNMLGWYVLWFFFINDNQCLEIFKTKPTTLTSLFQFENGSNKIKLESFFWLTAWSFTYFDSKLMLLGFTGKLSSLQLKFGNSRHLKNFGITTIIMKFLKLYWSSAVICNIKFTWNIMPFAFLWMFPYFSCAVGHEDWKTFIVVFNVF